MYNNLTQLISKKALVRVQDTQIGRDLESRSMNKLLQIELFINLRLHLIHKFGVFGLWTAAQ